MNCIRDEGGDIGETESKEGLEVSVAISDLTISIFFMVYPPFTPSLLPTKTQRLNRNGGFPLNSPKASNPSSFALP